MHARPAVAVLLLASTLTIGCQHAPGSGPSPASAPNALGAIDTRGNPVPLAEPDGKVRVIEFFAVSREPYRRFTPAIQKLHERFAGEDRVEVVGVVCDDDNGTYASLGAYLDETGVTFPVVRDGRAIAEEYGIGVLPAVVLIARDGRVLRRQWSFGESSVDSYERLIRADLAAGD